MEYKSATSLTIVQANNAPIIKPFVVSTLGGKSTFQILLTSLVFLSGDFDQGLAGSTNVLNQRDCLNLTSISAYKGVQLMPKMITLFLQQQSKSSQS